MKRPVQPDNKFFLSNTSIYEDNVESSLEFFNHGSWTINSIETGKPIRSLSLGDWLEYIDPELSFIYARPTPTAETPPLDQEERTFYRAAIAKVIGIAASEVSLQKEDGSRYILGNSAKFINYKSMYQYQPATEINESSSSAGRSKFSLIVMNKLTVILFFLAIILITLIMFMGFKC